MNKIEIVKGLYRQNVYNINTLDGHYHHYTCYFDADFNLFAVFSAGTNQGMIEFTENKDLTPLSLPDNVIQVIKDCLESYTYSHIQPIDLYNPDSMWNNSLKGIYNITERDEIVINLHEKTA